MISAQLADPRIKIEIQVTARKHKKNGDSGLTGSERLASIDVGKHGKAHRCSDHTISAGATRRRCRGSPVRSLSAMENRRDKGGG
jgi:hypothetical protein